jgi:hypothetical protein
MKQSRTRTSQANDTQGKSQAKVDKVMEAKHLFSLQPQNQRQPGDQDALHQVTR